jgi:lipopolysaccharide transport system permease protein
MQDFPATPVEMLASLWRNRSLIHALAKREVLGRYRGSAVGLLWSFLNPLFMLAVYTFVFSVIFQARWGSDSGSKTEFALLLFAGLIVFNLFADCINRAPSLILVNVNYVKKMVFPLEILPLVGLIAAGYHTLIALLVWLVAYAVLIGIPHPTVFLLPMVIAPFALFIIGLSWALASLGVFLRDVGQLVGVFVTTMMFLSPVFYPVSALPEEFQLFLYINPLTPVIEMTRDVLFWGHVPDVTMVVPYWLAAGIVAWWGFAWFQRIRRGFADVL